MRLLFFNWLYFFRLTANLRGRYRDFPYTPCPHTYVTSATVNISHQSGMIFITDEPALTHPNQPELILHIIYCTLGGIHSVGLDKCTVTHIHYYNRIRGIFTALKILVPCLFIPLSIAAPGLLAPTPRATTELFTISLVFASR